MVSASIYIDSDRGQCAFKTNPDEYPFLTEYIICIYKIINNDFNYNYDVLEALENKLSMRNKLYIHWSTNGGFSMKILQILRIKKYVVVVRRK